MDYSKILKELQDYYSNLLIIQYNGKQKAKATIELLTRLVYSNMVLMQIRDGFDWRTAKGAQLEIIGKWVGISRSYTGDATWDNTFLAYPSWDDTTDTLQGGYSDYTNFDTLEGGVLTYEDLNTFEQELSLEDYRTVIGLKIIKNSIIHNQGNIDKAIWEYFGGQTLYSNASLASGISLYNDKKLNDYYGKIIKYDNPALMVAVDANTFNAQNWEEPQLIGSGTWTHTVYGNNKYVTIDSSGNVITSSDGENWSVPVNIGMPLDYLIFAQSKFVAIGHVSNNEYFTTSSDGETWSTAVKINPNSPASYMGTLRAIAYKPNNTYVALGSSLIFYSTNSGSTWMGIQRNTGTYDVIYAQSKFVAVGNSGIIISSNGQTWSDITSIGNYNLFSITYGQSKFVAVGSKGCIVTSADGTTWTTPIQVGTVTWNKVAYGNGVFVAVGNSGYISVSSDGVKWTEPINFENIDWFNIYHAQDKFILSGRNGNITYSLDISYSEIKTFATSSEVQEDNTYKFSLSNVYTTWQPHEITYHYASSLATVINMCKNKGVLPAPTGVEINLLVI